MLTNSIMSHSPCAGSGTRGTFFTPDNQSYNCHAFLNISTRCRDNLSGTIGIRPLRFSNGIQETEEGVCCLSLITDAYSHKIVGWALGPTLETIYPLQALQMALATIDENTAGRLIHHSDRGCQYCSDAYVSELKRHGIGISMT